MATLSTAQRVRLLIQDPPIREDVTLIGDGTANSFLLPHANITSASAFIPGAGNSSWTATGFTYALNGEYSFSGVISALSAYRMTYTHTTFSDDEIDQFLADGGGVKGAALEAVQALMFDAVKRARWMSSAGESYDDTNAQTHLREMYTKLSAELEKEAAAQGGMVSWSVNQGSY